jgi:carboxymethylenebutenolidase
MIHPAPHLRRLALALALAGPLLAPGARALAADAPSPPAKDPLDGIVAAQVELGSDAWRATKLAASPRRHEMAAIKRGDKHLAAFVAYPDKTEKAPVIVMIPEDQGLNNWAKAMADEIAAMGYVVIVPDMLSGMGPNGGDRDSFTDLKSVFAAHSLLPRQGEAPMTADLNAWADWGKALPQFNGKLATIGFAWGGGRAFYFATQRKDLAAAFVFYDTAPPADRLANLSAPVYAFYAEVDPRVTRSLDATKAAMTAAGKTYEPVLYPGSDHMFVRLGEEPRDKNPANILARDQALARLQQLLGKM